MKYYKITNNGICKNQKYEVGETYSLSDDPIPCRYGFHFCKNPDNLFNWYIYKKNKTVIFEVKPLGKTIHKADKSVTNKIKILRQIKPEEYNDLFKRSKFDKNSNCIHYKSSNDYEYWKEYDENNNLIYYKNSYGFKEWKEYDENNNLIYWKTSDGFECWRKYDKNNNLIYYRDSSRNEVCYKYDENNNLTHFKNSNGYEWRNHE